MLKALRPLPSHELRSHQPPMYQRHIPADFLHDESRACGSAEGIAFPLSTEEISAALREARDLGKPVTLQGARTGISAGAVPEGGVILSLAKMDKILGLSSDDAPLLRVQPGASLVSIRRHLSGTPYFFPPDPTEASASIGGMASCNASGACSYAYGATRSHIEGATLVLADGDTLALRRGQARASGSRFSLLTAGGRVIAGDLPRYNLPSVKNAAGYWIKPGMDLLDLFIGSEGTLGVIAELDLRLALKPHRTLGVLCHLPGEAQALDLVGALRAAQGAASPHALVAIEYFDDGAIGLIRSSAARSGLLLPAPRPHWTCALYVEWALASDDRTPEPLLAELLARCGAHADDTWVAADAPTLDKLKAFRHAVPEQVNAIIAERKRDYPKLTKLGTDLSVPDSRLCDVMALYRRDLDRAGLQHVIFGHIGNNHVHVNILPRNLDEFAAGKALYLAWARQVIEWGGSVSAEHGIGRIKRELLALMYGPEGIQAMRQLKALFDPEGRLNPGRLF